MSIRLNDPAPFPPQLIAELFRGVVRGLLGVLGYFKPKYPKTHLLLPFGAYLGRVEARFARLIARYLAGTLTLPKPRLRRTRASQAGAVRQVRLPREKAWVIDALGWRAVGFAGNLDLLLARPDTASIVAQFPQAQRLLRPLCHMLGIAPACIAPLPKRPRGCPDLC